MKPGTPLLVRLRLGLHVRLHWGHAVLAMGLLLVEIYIALYVDDDIIRPYVGDVLVVPLLYHAIAAWLVVPPARLALAVLGFAFFVETLQYLDIVNFLGLQNNTLARVVIGTYFSVIDLLAYTVGALLSFGLHTFSTKLRS